MSKILFALFAFLAVMSVSGCKTSMNAQRDEFNSALQAHTEAETSINQAFDKLRKARANVNATIERIADIQRRETARGLFEKNEQAWKELVESETLIQQGAKSTIEEPDIRYNRIAEADRASMRVEQLNDLAVSIRVRFQ